MDTSNNARNMKVSYSSVNLHGRLDASLVIQCQATSHLKRHEMYAQNSKRLNAITWSQLSTCWILQDPINKRRWGRYKTSDCGMWE
ncbi:hypothetical protein AG1IA_07500 [Rhizoctonia solani AG-1 IA]|uniref:Uncharacterized protein n=1 Tax=Thanatephorus cucumeris (strain AG1-IA) TaxID=983506 RepID=L8WNY2_THACA|nr:hypothetical protein AG1IA_07500 [Rhizoctonia solani AG-1 IA]